MKATTIKDVAKMAGVSIATVSYVLNGSQKVSASTSQKVLSAAADLDYTPSALARGLVGKKTRTVAVAVASSFCRISSDAGLSGILQGIGESTYAADYSLMLLFPKEVQPALIAELASKGVEGLLLIGFTSARAVVESAPFPVFTADFIYSQSRENVQEGVWFSFQESFALALRHLAELGRERVFLLGPSLLDQDELVSGVQTLSGQDEVALKYLPVEPTAAGGYRAIDKLALTVPFDGIITLNDSIAIGVLHALARKGINVPGEVGVIGCTDDPAASYSEPPLTTVRLPWSTLGQALVGRFLGRDFPNTIQPKLVIRESCGSALWI